MILEVRDLRKSFGTKEVLKGISFSAESGEAIGLLGRNGAGKTTTIRIILDVFKGNSGEILIDGKPINYDEITYGYLPEERGLYPKKKIIDQLVYFAELKGMSGKNARKAADQWLERLEMSEYRNKKPQELSKGNQQKIQLISAVIHNPDVLILDEPFSGLDPVNALMLQKVVQEEITKGKIVLFSSHQMNYIEEFCNNIIVMRDGEVSVGGRIDDIKDSYHKDRLVIRSMDSDRIFEEYSDVASKQADGSIFISIPSEEQRFAMMAEITNKYNIDSISVWRPSLLDIFVEYAGDDETKGEAK